MQTTVTLMQTARSYKSTADKVVATFGLSQATAWPAIMIGRFGKNGGVRPGIIAEVLGLGASSIVRVIDQLVEQGLVQRKDDSQDRRAKLLKLTAQGEKVVEKLESALVPFRYKLLKNISINDLEATLRVLDSFNSAIQSINESYND